MCQTFVPSCDNDVLVGQEWELWNNYSQRISKLHLWLIVITLATVQRTFLKVSSLEEGRPVGGGGSSEGGITD